MENFKNIWTEVEPTVSLCDSLYQAVSSPLENLDAKKLYNLRTFFFRGIFEQACEQNNLDKKSYSKCIIHCFKQFILSTSAGSKLDEEKINKYAAQFFDATEITLNDKEDFYKNYINTCSQIYKSGKESYKKGGLVFSTEALSVLFNNKKFHILDFHKWK